MHRGFFYLFFCQFFHRIVQCVEKNVDVFFFILARLLEEGNRIFGAALERGLVEQDVDIVQQHAVKGRHVELVLFALLAATLQACWRMPSR